MRTLKLVEANHPTYRYEVINMDTQTNETTAPAPVKARGSKKKAPAPAKGPKIQLTDRKPEYKDGSARALWFAALVKANGKTPEEFVDAATKKPPALTKDGKPEAPAGWLRYFLREGLAQLVS